MRGGRELERNKGNKRKRNNVSSGVGRGIMTQWGIKNMIEIERKFKLNEAEKESLLAGAIFVGEKTFTDVYYDTEDFTLSKNNIWLRKRDDEFQLKLPILQKEKVQTTQFQEIEGEDKIREIFAIPSIVDFETDIKVFGYEIFCQLETTRRKYQKENFEIDLDQTVSNFPSEQDFFYRMVEIELMVSSNAEILNADKKIMAFAKKNQLKIGNIRGKVAEYLFRKKPKHYEALIKAGVV